MLLQLNIKNFALIDELTISFNKGFNVLTGETGAGKSILIDAISYVLGNKFNKELIRTGENKTYVEAIFTIENENAENILKQMNIEYEDIIIISRETFQYGKSITKVNGKSIILSKLKNITSTLLDIHGQHENQNLLDSDKHIFYLDYFCESHLNELMKDYKIKYNKFINIDKKIKELSGSGGENEKLIDFLKYQIKEIEKANLNEEEESNLENRFKELSNAEKISKVLLNSYNMLYGGISDNSSIIDSLNFIIKEMDSISNIDKIKDIVKPLKEAYYIIEESIRNIGNIKDSLYYDENELDVINSRLFEISTYKKKYGNTIDEILKYKYKIKLQYDEILNKGEIIEKLEKDKCFIIKEIKEIGDKIHNIRQREALNLEKNIKNELNYIGLEKTIFEIKIIKSDKFFENGIDKVEFYVSTNPGEPTKPLNKVVSGGELSRMMLALKSIFVDKDKIPSVIFDEIDTGISGGVAQRVGEKIFSISYNRQVFCITHLPQIACISDTHYYIHKEIKNGKTFTKVEKLSQKQKENEIARIIGGCEVTPITLQNSREFIKMANKKKKQLI